MTIVRTKTERRFNPHRLLLGAAQHHLKTAKEKKSSWSLTSSVQYYCQHYRSKLLGTVMERY